MTGKGCKLERRIATYAAKGRVLKERAVLQIQGECGCTSCAAAIGSRVLAARIAQINAENAAAALAARKCPRCKCSRLAPCVLRLDDGESVALCAPAGTVPGHKTCSGCLTPEKRTDPRVWTEGAAA